MNRTPRAKTCPICGGGFEDGQRVVMLDIFDWHGDSDSGPPNSQPTHLDHFIKDAWGRS